MEEKISKIKDITELPVYIINMDERKDRWKRAMSSEAIRKFKNLQSISATNGKELKYRTEKRISMGTRLRIFRNYRRSHYEIATLGAIGASISHIRTWQKFYDSGNHSVLLWKMMLYGFLTILKRLIPFFQRVLKHAVFGFLDIILNHL